MDNFYYLSERGGDLTQWPKSNLVPLGSIPKEGDTALPTFNRNYPSFHLVFRRRNSCDFLKEILILLRSAK